MFQELTVFLPGAAADDGGIDESNEQSEASEYEASHPEDDEPDLPQTILQHRLAGDKHGKSRQKKNGAPQPSPPVARAAHETSVPRNYSVARSFRRRNIVWRRDSGVLSSPRDHKEPHDSVNAMQITKQLAIFLENRPGMLAAVAEALAEAKINIYAISTSDTIDHTVIRLVLSDCRKALHVFEERGTLVVEDDVLMVEGDNRPGSLARITRKLAAAKVNVEYAYSATSPNARRGLLILRVRDAGKALKVLNS